MPNILLVEDDPALSELIASYLERNGYHVNVISRGDQVRERARSTPPDLVILDLMLPGLDGLQVCRLLRAVRAHGDLARATGGAVQRRIQPAGGARPPCR